jgi:competence protein ComGC
MTIQAQSVKGNGNYNTLVFVVLIVLIISLLMNFFLYERSQDLAKQRDRSVLYGDSMLSSFLAVQKELYKIKNDQNVITPDTSKGNKN